MKFVPGRERAPATKLQERLRITAGASHPEAARDPNLPGGDLVQVGLHAIAHDVNAARTEINGRFDALQAASARRRPGSLRQVEGQPPGHAHQVQNHPGWSLGLLTVNATA